MTMANSEMETLRELDADFLRVFANSLWIYYAEDDDWVGEQREVVQSALRGTSAEIQGRIVLDRDNGIPHSFCISECAACFITARLAEVSDFFFLPRRQTIAQK
jgi:Lipid-droplet associated hydrolase